jgi:hypothetical protein
VRPPRHLDVPVVEPDGAALARSCPRLTILVRGAGK